MIETAENIESFNDDNFEKNERQTTTIIFEYYSLYENLMMKGEFK